VLPAMYPRAQQLAKALLMSPSGPAPWQTTAQLTSEKSMALRPLLGTDICRPPKLVRVNVLYTAVCGAASSLLPAG
jgi:hypothetical protein